MEGGEARMTRPWPRPCGSFLLQSLGFGGGSARCQGLHFVATFGSYGTGDGQFNWPTGVAVGTDGSIVVADSANHRIQVVNAAGKFLFTFGSKSPSWGPTNGPFASPFGVAAGPNGTIVVADSANNAVQV